MENMNLVNLTPHAITIIGPDSSSEPVVIAPSGQVARVSSTAVVVGEAHMGRFTIPVTVTEYGEVEGLPEPQAGVAYIVSGMVAAQVNRTDVFSPGEQVRNDKGQVVGCKTLNQSYRPQ